jgi:HTH-type transcriptional regulator / antitoxin MqsA
MPKRAKTQPCPECGGTMRYEKHDDKLVYKGNERIIKTLGWWCTRCGEGILSGDALKGHEKAFLQFKAEVDEVMSPAEVAAVREKLGLSQRKAGELLGGGPRAFQKYEAGKQAVSAPMSNLLRLLSQDPSRLRELVSSRPLVSAGRPSKQARTGKRAAAASTELGRRVARPGPARSSVALGAASASSSGEALQGHATHRSLLRRQGQR